MIVAAFTATSRIENLVHMPFGSIGQALSTFAGQNYGARKPERIRTGFYQSMVDSYSGLGKTPAEIYQLIWGTYMDSQEYGLRPLSKWREIESMR